LSARGLTAVHGLLTVMLDERTAEELRRVHDSLSAEGR
jgi:hypothetical protein